LRRRDGVLSDQRGRSRVRRSSKSEEERKQRDRISAQEAQETFGHETCPFDFELALTA
jgi:hypothetical protein